MKHLPFEASIAKPCQQQWTAMSGSASARRCDSCQKTVHNFAALTPRQIERLVHRSNGHLCARITRREDGSIVTAPSGSRTFGAPLLVSAALLLAPALRAQTQSDQRTGTIAGSIADAAGASLSGAKIEVVQPGQPDINAVSDRNGSFRLQGPIGPHTIQVSMPGFNTLMQKVTFTADEHTMAPIVLQLGTITMGDIVLVDTRPWYKKLGTRTKRLLHLSS
jgi:hypothetical protein